MKPHVAGGLLAVALCLSACTLAPTPPPGRVGETGAVQTVPGDALKEVMVERVAVYAEGGLSDCKVRQAMSYRQEQGAVIPPPQLVGPVDGGQAYDVALGTGVLQIDCALPDGKWETRKMEALFYAKEYDDFVASAMVGAVLFGGIIGVVGAQDRAEQAKYWPYFNFHTPVIHMIPPRMRADAAAMAAVKTAAAGRWDAALAALSAQCGKTSRAPTVCGDNAAAYIARLRAIDESYISGVPAPAPATPAAAAPAAGQPGS